MAKELTPAEIGQIGEEHLMAALRAKGFDCHRNTQLPGVTDIVAVEREEGKIINSLRVQVKTAIVPCLPADLSWEEKKAIISRAHASDSEAWMAQVRINEDGDLVGEIKWGKLN